MDRTVPPAPHPQGDTNFASGNSQPVQPHGQASKAQASSPDSHTSALKTIEPAKNLASWRDYWPSISQQQTILTLLVLVLAVHGSVWVSSIPQGGMINIELVAGKPPEFLVDVNLAPWQELALLPGIGEKLAKRMVEARERLGGFRRAEDLLLVDQIGKAKLNGMKRHLKGFAPAGASQPPPSP